MKRPEISFEQLSATYGEDTAHYMRATMDRSDRQPGEMPAIQITLEGLSQRYGEAAALAIMREIEKVASQKTSATADKNDTASRAA
jgi:hypothetical protein